MDDLTPGCPRGAVAYCKSNAPGNWHKFSLFLKTEESLDDYAKFRSSLMDTYTSLVMSVTSDNECSMEWFSWQEMNMLHCYYAAINVLSSGRMRHDTDINTIFDGDVEGLPPPLIGGFRSHLNEYKSHLQSLQSIRQYFACRKGLAKLDFIKWDSDFDEIFGRLKSANKWPEIPDFHLRVALTQHFSLLRKLNENSSMMANFNVGNMPEGDKLLEAINQEYSKHLSDLTKGFVELRTKRYLNHMELKILQQKCADQAEASRTACIPKDCHFTQGKLSQLKGGALFGKRWILDKISRLKGRVGGRLF